MMYPRQQKLLAETILAGIELGWRRALKYIDYVDGNPNDSKDIFVLTIENAIWGKINDNFTLEKDDVES